MKFNKSDIKRLAIFVFYDSNGIVDDYVLFLLKSLKEAMNDLIIMSNSYLSPNEKRKLQKFSDKIKIRHNIGLDAGAFKDAYDEYKEYFQEFDEILLVNDTFYGPFIPFKNICETMENKNLDFWGLSANYDSVDGYGYLPDHMIHAHIQTFFIAFRSNVLKSKAFNNYWKDYNVNKMRSFNNVVTKHEIAFTYYLEQAGFKWDVYTDLDKYHGKVLEENFNSYAYCSYDMIKNCNCPFIKRKNFVFDKKDALFLTNGDDAKKSLQYIEENKLYDINLIWKNLIRLYKPTDLYYGLNLNFIVKEKEKPKKKTATLIILEEEKYLHHYITFLKNADIDDIYVTTINENMKTILKENNITTINRESFLYENYDYICIIKDTYLKKQQIPTVYQDNFTNFISNGFKNQKYINGIVDIFEENKYIGLLSIPESMHSDYFEDFSNENNLINASQNCCWIKSELFNLDIINKTDFVQEYIKNIQGKYIMGKIFNEENVMNMMANYEYITQQTYQSLRTHHETITNSLSDALYHIRHTKCFIPNSKIKGFIYKVLRKIYHKFFK